MGKRLFDIACAATALLLLCPVLLAVALWVRPDKYVGFRGDPRSTAGLRSYLGGVFSDAARQPQDTSSS